MDLGKATDNIVLMLEGGNVPTLRETSGDIWEILTNMAEAEVYDKIEMAPQGKGPTSILRAVPLVHERFGFECGTASKDINAPRSFQEGKEWAEHI